MLIKNINQTKTHFIFLLLLTVMLFNTVGCSSANTNTVDVSELQETLLSADNSLPDMTTVSSTSDDAQRLFTYVSDMDYSKVGSYLLSYSSEGLADEIVVIAVKDSADVESAKQALETHRQNRVSFYKSYNASQAQRAEKGLVFTEDSYAVLIVSDNRDSIKASFEAAVGKE